jgi:hypothetical protein
MGREDFEMTNGLAGLRIAAIGLSLLTLAACAPPPSADGAADMPVRGAYLDNPPSANRNIALTHRFTLRVPRAEAEAIQQKHVAECGKLGCTILSTSVDRSVEGHISARTSLRIRPEAYNAFANVLTAPPAKIISHSQSAEDLATPIFDAERRLEAKTVLRERLTAMLRDASAKTAADLIAIEKELAQAQGEIEIITSQRDTLRTRTDTVRVDIAYVGAAGQVGGVDLTPIHQSIRDIDQTIVNSISTLIGFTAMALPWLPVIAIIGWIVRRGIRRRKTRRAQQPKV